MISDKMTSLINQQVANELHSSNAYLAIASYMETNGWKVLGEWFFRQAGEERDHALKFLRYLLDVGAKVEIAAVPDVKNDFASVEEAVKTSLDQEKKVTAQIHDIMALAQDERDFPTTSFLKWFIDEQVEEEASVGDLLLLVQRAGEKNLLLVEDRLMRSAPSASE